MSSVGQPERATQNRVVALFRDELHYRYLGDWTDREGNSNVEEEILSAWLAKSGYTPQQIGVALHRLRTEADNHSRTLYGYGQADVARIKERLNHYLNVREIVRKASDESLDLKAYEADMRHLIDTYIEADQPRKISPFDGMSLLELIVKTGIADAIALQLGGLKGNQDAIAETIENNVRSKIVKEHLNDPALYEKMSALLDEVIAARKAKALEYEEYLKRIGELAKKVESGRSEETPATLDTPGKRAIYNNLRARGASEEARRVADAGAPYGGAPRDEALGLALSLDEAIKRVRPDGWRGVRARELVIKEAMYRLLPDIAEVERLFLIIKAQREY